MKKQRHIRPRAGRKVMLYSWSRQTRGLTPPMDQWTGTVTASAGGNFYYVKRDYDGEVCLYHSSKLAYL